MDTQTRQPRCLQIPPRRAFDLDGQIYGNEDCRYANVWRPQTSETGLPVYVDIHGGGDVVGEGQDLAHLAAEHHAVAIRDSQINKVPASFPRRRESTAKI